MTYKKPSKAITGLLLLISLGFIWGTGYSIARFAMTNDVPPLGYSLWQSLGPAIIIWLVSSTTTSPVKLSTKHNRYYLICGLTGIVIPNTSMYFAAAHLPASILAMIVNTVPIVAYPLALLVNIEKFNWQRMIGIIFACCGLMFIILPRSSLPTPDMIPWVLSTLITPLSFAVCSIYIARYQPNDSNSLSSAAGMLLFSSLILTPLVLMTGNFYSFHLPLTLADYVIVLEVLLSSAGYILFFQLVRIAGPVYYSLVDTIVVLTGIFWGYIIFGERLNQWTGIALCFILLALLLVTRQQGKISSQHD